MTKVVFLKNLRIEQDWFSICWPDVNIVWLQAINLLYHKSVISIEKMIVDEVFFWITDNWDVYLKRLVFITLLFWNLLFLIFTNFFDLLLILWDDKSKASDRYIWSQFKVKICNQQVWKLNFRHEEFNLDQNLSQCQ